MADKASSFNLNNQAPVIQLLTSVIIVLLSGTLIFYMFVFAGSLIFKADLTEMLAVPSSDISLKAESILRYIQVCQQISMFIIPSLVVAWLMKTAGSSFLNTGKLPGSLSVLLVILIAFLLIPVTTYSGIINSKMNLPEWLSGIEEWMRTKEEYAARLTGLLIYSSGFWDMIITVFVIAVVPSLAEELFFRGVLQQISCRIFRSVHLGIWITAIFFSAIHLQFFGFIPRLILGLTYGYLFYWSKNLWIPVLAHFINNLVPVVLSYFNGWKDLSDQASGSAEKQVFLPLFSSILIVSGLYYFWAEHRKNNSEIASTGTR
jgi:membrane protease YdiL (CAAX protease family)